MTSWPLPCLRRLMGGEGAQRPWLDNTWDLPEWMPLSARSDRTLTLVPCAAALFQPAAPSLFIHEHVY